MTLNIYFSGQTATGRLFWDDGESELQSQNPYNFVLNNYQMTSTTITANAESPSMDNLFPNSLEKIRIIGVNGSITASKSGTVLEVLKMGNVNEIILNVNIGADFTIDISIL